MKWLQAHRRRLVYLNIASVVAAISVILWVNLGGVGTIDRWQYFLIILPWIVFFGTFFPMAYLFLFNRSHPAAAKVVLQVAFWAFLLVIGVIVVNLLAYGFR